VVRVRPGLVTVVLGAWAAACGGPSGAPVPVPAPAVDGGGSHLHEAPHGGVLVELGEHFAHLEVVLDASTGGLTIYMLDAEAEQSIRIAQSALSLTLEDPALPDQVFTLAPVVSALTGETAGDSSQFAAVIAELQGAARVAGRVREIAVKGQPFHDVTFVWEPTR
jgi:hypothetical protein